MIASEEHATLQLQRLHIFGTPKPSPFTALNHVSKSHAAKLCWLLHTVSCMFRSKQKLSNIKLELKHPKWKLMMAGGRSPKVFVVLAMDGKFVAKLPVSVASCSMRVI